jgi:hypothetical protein
MRADLVSGLDGTQTLFMVAHHLVVEIVSWRLILEDLEAALSGGALTTVSSLPPLPFQTWCEDKVSHAVSDRHFPPTNYAYWDIDRDNLTYEDSSRAGFVLDRDLTSLCLGSSHDSMRTKPADLFIAALALSFKKTFTDRQTSAVCVEGHGREARAAGLDPLSKVGWFTNIVPVQVDVLADHDPVDFVHRIKDSKICAEKDCINVESRSYATWPSAKHTLRPPIRQLTSARGLAASCTPALVDRTTTIQDHLSHQVVSPA